MPSPRGFESLVVATQDTYLASIPTGVGVALIRVVGASIWWTDVPTGQGVGSIIGGGSPNAMLMAPGDSGQPFSFNGSLRTLRAARPGSTVAAILNVIYYEGGEIPLNS